MEKGKLERRCPRLGGQVSFGYCWICGEEDLPCQMILDRWSEYFDIMEYLKKNLSHDNLDKVLKSNPKPKMESLVDIIEQAKKRIS